MKAINRLEYPNIVDFERRLWVIVSLMTKMKQANGSILEKAQEERTSLRKEIKTFSINVQAFLCK